MCACTHRENIVVAWHGPVTRPKRRRHKHLVHMCWMILYMCICGRRRWCRRRCCQHRQRRRRTATASLFPKQTHFRMCEYDVRLRYPWEINISGSTTSSSFGGGGGGGMKRHSVRHSNAYTTSTGGAAYTYTTDITTHHKHSNMVAHVLYV